jgi:glycosyltransferase involved in cell wall biosynthesis
MHEIFNHHGGMTGVNRTSAEHSTISALPRLSYLGEVPVECSYHGSALLWRLLQNYPAKDLLIVEGIHRSSVERRLPGVRYIHPPTPGIGRMLRTRYAIQVSEILYRTIPILAASILPSVACRRPEAIITVCHGLFWLVAAKVANILKVPLHLIVHDHVPDTVAERLRERISHDFGRVYSTAASRFCVSEGMVVEYERMFGVAGQVLYPSRARSPLRQSSRAVRCSKGSGRLTGVFAGTVAGPECADALAALARQLARVGGRLVIYGVFTRAQAAPCGLDLPNVEFPGLVPARVLSERCQEEADFLYVPMKFGRDGSVNARISFPSKLADYTEMGLPLLIRGPEYCSAVQWARKNPGVAQVVETEDEKQLLEAIKRLSNPETRRTLAEEALRIGELYFSHSRAESILFSALARSAVKEQSGRSYNFCR